LTSIAELADGEKSSIQSLAHSINHSAYLMHREPKLSLQSKAQKLRRNYRAGCVISIVGSVNSGKLLSMPNVHPMLTTRHFLIAPWK